MAEIGKDTEKAKALLERGELVAIPTETVYGLAGNALNEKAVVKIFTVKNRPSFDPLIVHVPNLSSVTQFAENIPEKARQLAEQCWPGPLTLLLKKKQIIPDLVTSGLDEVAIRCPHHPLTLKLLDILDFPLAAPSANPFGYVSPTTPEHVNEQLGDKISYILDGGPCRIGIESTIAGFQQDTPVIFRLGGLSIEDIESKIGKVDVQINTASDPKAPGQLKSHYAPHKKLMIGNIEQFMNEHEGVNFGVLSFQKDHHTSHQLILSPSGNLEEAAQNLFSYLRMLDKMPVEVVFTEFVPEQGLGKAINDRLRRAAAEK